MILVFSFHAHPYPDFISFASSLRKTIGKQAYLASFGDISCKTCGRRKYRRLRHRCESSRKNKVRSGGIYEIRSNSVCCQRMAHWKTESVVTVINFICSFWLPPHVASRR